MAIRKTLASGWVFAIGDTSGGASVTYTPILGGNNWSEEWTENENDLTDFQSGDWNEHSVTRRGLSITLEGFFKHDESTGDRDPGQELVEAAGQQTGVAAYRDFRVYHNATGVGFTGEGTFRLSGAGGGTDDNASWGFTFVFNGQPAAYQHA